VSIHLYVVVYQYGSCTVCKQLFVCLYIVSVFMLIYMCDCTIVFVKLLWLVEVSSGPYLHLRHNFKNSDNSGLYKERMAFSYDKVYIEQKGNTNRLLIQWFHVVILFIIIVD